MVFWKVNGKPEWDIYSRNQSHSKNETFTVALYKDQVMLYIFIGSKNPSLPHGTLNIIGSGCLRIFFTHFEDIKY